MFEIEFFLGSLAFIFRERLGHQLRYELKDGIQHHYNITVNIPNGLVTIWDKVNTQVCFISFYLLYILNLLICNIFSLNVVEWTVTQTGSV